MMKEPLKAIEVLAENEVLISRIYRAFSRRFPDHHDFWEKMAEEESEHAGILRSVVSDVKEETVRFREGAFDDTSVEMFRDYLKFSLARAREQEIPLKDAFETALAIEHDLIERNFLDQFVADTGGKPSVFEGLASSTREHHRRLVSALEKSGQST